MSMNDVKETFQHDWAFFLSSSTAFISISEREWKTFELINDPVNGNLMRHSRVRRKGRKKGKKISIHPCAVSQRTWFEVMIQFSCSIFLVDEISKRRRREQAWHYYSFITGDNKLTQLPVATSWILLLHFRFSSFVLLLWKKAFLLFSIQQVESVSCLIRLRYSAVHVDVKNFSFHKGTERRWWETELGP